MIKLKEKVEDEAFNAGCITFFLGDIILVALFSTMMDLPYALILTIVLTPITVVVFFLGWKGLSLLINSYKYVPEVRRKPYKPRKMKVIEVVEETQVFRDLNHYYREPEILDHECSWCGKAITKSDYDNYQGMCYQDFDMLDSSYD